jgi:hypothetical protein
MRAKMSVYSVEQLQGGQEKLHFTCVGGNKPYGAQGESEDNTFARYTPSGTLELLVNNPDLAGKFKPGQKFYLDFTEADE